MENNQDQRWSSLQAAIKEKLFFESGLTREGNRFLLGRIPDRIDMYRVHSVVVDFLDTESIGAINNVFPIH